MKSVVRMGMSALIKMEGKTTNEVNVHEMMETKSKTALVWVITKSERPQKVLQGV